MSATLPPCAIISKSIIFSGTEHHPLKRGLKDCTVKLLASQTLLSFTLMPCAGSRCVFQILTCSPPASQEGEVSSRAAEASTLPWNAGSFAMHLKFLWLLQIVPQGRKWTSAFRTCGGGYLKSNHIALTGLSRSSLTEQVHLGPYFAHHAVPCKLIEIMSCCRLNASHAEEARASRAISSALTGLLRFSPSTQVRLGLYFAHARHHAVPCKLIQIMSCCLSMPLCQESPCLKSKHFALTGLMRFSPSAQLHLGLYFAHARHHAVQCKLIEIMSCCLSMPLCQGSPCLKSNHIALTGLMRFTPSAQVGLGLYFAHHAVPCKLIQIMSCCLSIPLMPRKPLPREQPHPC